jgi:hypothetical protein
MAATPSISEPLIFATRPALFVVLNTAVNPLASPVGLGVIAVPGTWVAFGVS